MAEKEEVTISRNPWLDKEYKQGLPLFTREPGLEIDDLPERLGLLDEVTVKDSIEATKFTELADTPSDYGLDKQFAMSDGEGAITWAYPFWKPSGSSIFFRKRVAVGHSHPMVEFHVYKPQTKVQLRIGAKENPWVEWHSTDEANGFAAGIDDAANKLFKINYDSPIGTVSQLFLCMDAGNTRIGAYTPSPQVPYHIKESACASATYHPDAILAVESTTNAMIQVSAGTDAGIVFCDDDSNPPAGAVIYDHANEQLEFISATNERMWLSSVGILRTHGDYIHNDSGASSSFRADSHDADAYFECREDGTIKWTVGFDYSDSLKFKISEGVPGTSSRFEITSGGAIQLPNANQVIQWTGSAGGSGGLQYTDAGSAVRYALLFPGSDIVALVNRAANGTVELRANTSTAGAGGETTVVTVEDTDVTLSDGIGFNLQEDITFMGATGVNLIKFPDHLADALSFKEATISYLKFVTTNGSEAVVFGKDVTVPDLTVSTPVNIYALSHDSFADFVANEHIDHTSVSISAGGILSGGGTIAANRTISLAHSDVDHDQTTNFAAGEHFTEASIDHGSIGGLADDDHSQYILHSLADAANDFIVASGANTYIKKTLAETGAILEGDIQHDNLQGFVGAEHLSLPAAIASVLSDHDKVAHDALGLSHDSLTDVSVDDHHAQLHASEHQAGGGDPLNNLLLGASPYIKWQSGYLLLQTDEGTNNPTYVDIKGKGTGIGRLRIYDQDNAEYGQISADSGWVDIMARGTSPTGLKLQRVQPQNITCWESITSGNPYFYIYGWKTGVGVQHGQHWVDTSGDYNINAQAQMFLRAASALCLGLTSTGLYWYQSARFNDNLMLKFGTGSDYSFGYHEPTDTFQIVDGATLNSNIRAKLNASGHWDFIAGDLVTTGTLGCGNVTGGTYNALTLASVATGFTIAGGSTSKQLTCDNNFVVSTQLAAIGANTAKTTESTTVTAPLVLTTYDISIPVATSSVNGYLSSANWSTFNNKSVMATGSYTGDSAASRAITGVGFQPKYVHITQEETTPGGACLALYTNDQMVGDHANGAAVVEATGAMISARIFSLDADGFTIGDGGIGGYPNAPGLDYRWVAYG